MKTLIIVLEFAMYSLELKIKSKKKKKKKGKKIKFVSDLPTLFPFFFTTTLAETKHFFY
jgi:hypothetical protein